MDGNKARGVQFVAERILNRRDRSGGRGGGRGGGADPRQQSSLERGGAIYTELCFACHGADGRGTPTPGAAAGPRWRRRSPVAARQRASRLRHQDLLHGLTGPIDGRTYPQVMVPMGSNSDQWIADVASYVRNSFGNTGTLATPADVARVRAATGAKGAVDGRGAGGVAAAAARCRRVVEDHRQPRFAPGAASERRRRLQLPRQRRRRGQFPGLDDRRPATAGHVVPDRAAGAADAG